MTETRRNKKQERASWPSGGVSLVIAGAGTGKTKTLVEKVSNLIRLADVPPEHILILTFSRKAAEEIRERVTAKTGDSGRRVTSGTFHSFCLSLLREKSDLFLPAAGFSGFPSVLDGEEREHRLREMLAGRLGDYLGLPLDVVCNFLENSARLDEGSRRRLDRLGLLDRLSDAERDFASFKKAGMLIDFGDMIGYAIKLLESFPSLRKEINERYRHVLVDEFQDTSGDNFRLLKLLLPEGDPNLFVVGDDWQSIYGFRDARIDYIVKMKRHFPGVKVHRLTVNYRSRKEIVSLSNRFIRKNRVRTRKRLKSFRGKGGRVRGWPVRDLEEEAVLVGQILRRDLTVGGVTAVLYRNNWQGDLLALQLEEYRPLMESGRLRLMTMHASKGLEFDRVLVTGVSDGILPDASSDLEEERRLLYVGLTRAREDLGVIYHISKGGDISRFARELGFSEESIRSSRRASSLA